MVSIPRVFVRDSEKGKISRRVENTLLLHPRAWFFLVVDGLKTQVAIGT